MVQIVIMVIGMRLITFSLFGDNPLYCQGAVENANIARVIYPEWTPRFYVAQDVPEHYIEEIEIMVQKLLDVKNLILMMDLIGDLDHFMILMLNIG